MYTDLVVETASVIDRVSSRDCLVDLVVETASVIASESSSDCVLPVELILNL